MKLQTNVQSNLDTKKIQSLMGHGDDILIGYPEKLTHVGAEGPSMSTADLARTLTYGNDRIPARPFLEEGILSQKNELSHEIGVYYSKRVEGAGKNGLKKLGALGVIAVQEFVHSDYYKETVPNAPSTIERKSRRQKGKFLLSDKPLIDTGEMVNQTTYIVKEGGS